MRITKLIKWMILFITGGVIYISLELLFRQRSHISMFLLGAVCFVAIGLIDEYFPKIQLIPECIIGGLIITVLELLVGLIFNKDYSIWDYRNMPLNFKGEICVSFSVLWCLISMVAIELDNYLRKKLKL